MQIIQNIRDKGAAIVIAVIALSLIGFIMMDAKQGTGRMFSSNSTSIGKINGQTVENKEFDDKIKQTEAQYGQRITGTQVYQLRQFVWDKIVEEKIRAAEFEKLGLTFSPKEMMSIMFSNEAPQMLKQAFTDPASGVYDVEKVKEWWNRAKKFKDTARAMVDEQVIEPMKLEVLNNKYSGLLAASAYYPTWLQQKENADNKTFATISYVAIPYNVISDSTIKVSDDDITAYMSKHAKLYKQDGGRLLSYVTFSNNASAADTLRTLESVEALKPGFVADTNASNYVSRNMSAIKFTDNYTVKSKMTMAQKDSIEALAPGSVFGPYLDGNNFVLARMIGSRTIPDSVKSRHILIATNNPQTGQPTLSDSIAHARIDSIEMAVKSGADFNALVLLYSDDQGSKQKGGEYDWTSDQSLAPKYYEVLFYGNAGDKKVVKTEFGWHYIEVISQKAFQPAYKIAYMAKEITASDETVNMSSSKAAKLAGEARTAKELDAYIVKNGLKKVDVPNVVKENDAQLGGLQDARQLIKWAFGAKAGDVSEPFNVDDQYVVAVVNKVQPEGLPDAKSARPMVELTVRNAKKAEEIKKKIGATPTLESASTAYGKPVLTTGADSSLTFNAQIVNEIGQEPKVIGAAFNKAYQTKVSEPIEGANGVYVIKVIASGSKPADSPEVIAQQSADKVRLLTQQASYGWYESLKKQATITDSRSKFY